MNASTPRLSCTDFSFPDDFDQSATKIAGLGFNLIDISVRNRFPLTAPSYVRENPRAAAIARSATVDSLGLGVADVFCISHEPRALNDFDAGFRLEQREIFRAVVEFASELGATGITALPGNPDPKHSFEDAWAISVEELSWRVELAQQNGLELSVEPSVESMASTPELARALLRSTPGLRLTLDYSHFAYQGLDAAEVEPLIDDARVIHLRQARQGRVQTALEDGTIDFRRLFAASHARFDGVFSVEYVHGPAFPGDEVDVAQESVKMLELARRQGAAGSGKEPV